MTKPTSDTRKLNFITDQGSILASTNWARRVGAFAGVRSGAGRDGAMRSVGLFLNDGATLADGLGAGRAGFFLALGLGLVSDENLAATPATAAPPADAGGTDAWAGSGGTWGWYGGRDPSPLPGTSVPAG